jgi:hypothetical protein
MPTVKSERPITPSYKSLGGKEIWLTFDDGPHPVNTKKVPKMLEAHEVKARQSSVVLNHDFWRATAANLDLFIQKIKAICGAKFKTAASL